MNYIEQIAKMLGVELEEEFKLKGFDEIHRLTEESVEFRKSSYWLYADSCVLTDILFGHVKVIKLPKPILDEKEREYLSAVIKPFRDCVKYIFKHESPDYEYIVIEYYEKPTEVKSQMLFPSFEKGTMYKGMELGKKYTLEELGL